MKSLPEFTKDELSLLLFFESRAVDYSGRVESRRMNDGDRKIAKEWDKSRFIRFGRVASENLNCLGENEWCLLSEEAWQLAHEARKSRALRLWDKRQWQSTEEKRKEIAFSFSGKENNL